MEFFEENNCGLVRDARIIADRNTRKSKGYAYVEFLTKESVKYVFIGFLNIFIEIKFMEEICFYLFYCKILLLKYCLKSRSPFFLLFVNVNSIIKNLYN
jgi:hypothetical protein